MSVLSLAGMDCMRVHREQITSQLFLSAFDNPSNRIYGLVPTMFNRLTYNFRRQRILDLHKTKTRRFPDTFVNKSSSMAMYS